MPILCLRYYVALLLFGVCLGVASAFAGPVESQLLEEQGGWKAHVEINCFLVGQACGRFEYRALACHGDLEYVGVRDKGFEFREKLAAGKCAPGCQFIIDEKFRHYREVCFDKVMGEGDLSPVATGLVLGTTEAKPVDSGPDASAKNAADPIALPAKTQSMIALSPIRDCKNLPSASPNAETAKIQAATTTYFGDFRADPVTGVVSGLGRVQWANGDFFVGTLVEGKKHGKGCFVWSNGQQYDGDWLHDQQSGHAAILFANGNRYEGDVLDGIPDGAGGFLSVKGDQYAGEWKLGQKHGRGTFVWANNQSYSGDWALDQPSGRGDIVYANGDKYSGEVVLGVPQGTGVKYFAASGDRYEGLLQQGEADGEGVYYWKSGDKYMGLWRGGKKSGLGRYTWANGDYWEGLFEGDKQVDGVLHVASVTPASQDGVEVLLQQTRTVSETASGKSPKTTVKVADRGRMKQIPMVATELQKCSKPGSRANCQQSALDEIEQGGYFKHDWQTMFAEKTPAGGIVSYEVDRSSVSSRGIVFSWFRFLDSISGGSRKTGVKYDCRSRALEIQLLLNCEGGAQPTACVLDQNFDKYVGKAIPAATIKGWFKSACERSTD